MNKIETNLKDCYILEPKRFGDERGYFESITIEQLKEQGFGEFNQVSNSQSDKGIIRGMHFQKDPYCQTKVVRCLRGRVIDVVVDMRKDSPTYGQSTAVELTPENGRCLYVPRGFAHGYVALEDKSLFEYFVDNTYKPKMEDGIAWDDPALQIDWDSILEQCGVTEPVLSAKDKARTTLEENTTIFRREPKRYLITGYKGQLGYDIVRELEARGEHDYLALDIDEMDITNREQVMKIVKGYKPDVIFHCAAWTDVDKAENPENAKKVFDINVTGTKNLTDASIEVGAKMIYMSTDYIFDGTKDGIYTEEDQPNPKSQYGLTKLLGEEEVRRNPNHFITRISWVFGINGKNFIKTMLKLSDKYQQITVVNDQIGSPTYTVDLAKLLVEMAQTDKYGTYNVNNEEYCTWAEFAKYVMEINGKETEIVPVTTEEYYAPQYEKAKKDGKTLYIAERPENSKLSKDKLEEAGFERLPDWKNATQRYCKELKHRLYF